MNVKNEEIMRRHKMKMGQWQEIPALPERPDELTGC
jgi:hypothetical protein